MTRLKMPMAVCFAAWAGVADAVAPPVSEGPQAPAVLVGDEAEHDPAAHLRRMKAVIRQDAATSYGAECGSLEVPDRAMIPVEITGGGLPEIAVTFGRVRCGVGPTYFQGTGGVMVQFWIGSGGPVRLLLEQQMHGFTPDGDRLVTIQHGAYCLGGAGPDGCRVIYRWNDRDRRLEVLDRQLRSRLAAVSGTVFDYETLSR